MVEKCLELLKVADSLDGRPSARKPHNNQHALQRDASVMNPVRDLRGKIGLRWRVDPPGADQFHVCGHCPAGPKGRYAGIFLSEADGSGVQESGLGHQRLSIIDLSAAGREPMANEDGNISQTSLTSEMVNYKELRRELQAKGHRFRSESDTEVIIHLYEEEGTAAARRLNGMFAFALWNQRRGRLWLCRNRVGSSRWCTRGTGPDCALPPRSRPCWRIRA